MSKDFRDAESISNLTHEELEELGEEAHHIVEEVDRSSRIRTI